MSDNGTLMFWVLEGVMKVSWGNRPIALVMPPVAFSTGSDSINTRPFRQQIELLWKSKLHKAQEGRILAKKKSLREPTKFGRRPGVSLGMNSNIGSRLKRN